MDTPEPGPSDLPESPHRHRPPRDEPAAGNTKESSDRHSLWQTLKSCVGKDLSRISLPVSLNEPLSFLQRAAEDIEYSTLLDSAVASTEPSTRAALVAAFIVSHYASTAERSSKPFNPLLGETFEMVSRERGVAFLAEQVCHHPPTTAVHAVGNGWVYHTTHVIHNRFHGNSLEVWPEGSVHVLLLAHNEHFVYEQAHTIVHSIVFGSLWLDNTGDIFVQEVNHGQLFVSLRFKRYSCLFGEAKKLGDVEGKVTYNGGSSAATGASAQKHSVTRKLSGNWIKSLSCDGKELWRASPRPPAAETAGHNMTAWGWSLNAPPSASTTLPRTDSRFRPDQRALEYGDFQTATAEKDRVEHKQRQARVLGEQRGETHVPRWFDRRQGSDGRKVRFALLCLF
jgi:oxysterol-binding protein-related protein 3/6/7